MNVDKNLQTNVNACERVAKDSTKKSTIRTNKRGTEALTRIIQLHTKKASTPVHKNSSGGNSSTRQSAGGAKASTRQKCVELKMQHKIINTTYNIQMQME